MQLKNISISKKNARHEEDTGEEFENLKESIKKDSLIQKIVLRPGKEEGTFEVVAGGRRYRALLAINDEEYELKDSEYILYQDMNDDQATIWSIEENTQRLPFSALDLNKAALVLNKNGMKDKEIAQKLNVSQVRLKRLMGLSADFNKMPDNAKEQLGKLPDEAVLTDQHWSLISNKTDDKDVIKDVVDYIIDKEVPVKDVPAIVKMVEKNKELADGPAVSENKPSGTKEPVDEDSGNPLEYAHKGELILENHAGKDVLRIIGKGEDSEVPVEQYLNYLRHPEQFKCYVTFKLKIKPL